MKSKQSLSSVASGLSVRQSNLIFPETVVPSFRSSHLMGHVEPTCLLNLVERTSTSGDTESFSPFAVTFPAYPYSAYLCALLVLPPALRRECPREKQRMPAHNGCKWM